MYGQHMVQYIAHNWAGQCEVDYQVIAHYSGYSMQIKAD